MKIPIRLIIAGVIIASVYFAATGPSLTRVSDLQPTTVGIAQTTSSPATYEDVRSLVIQSIESSVGPGGLANVIQPTDQVFIKINANYGAVPGGDPTGYLTDPRVVRAVAELASAIVPASQIKIGEGISHIGTSDLVEFQQGGYDLDLDGELDGVPGVQFVCLNEPHNAATAHDPAYVTTFTNAPGHQNTIWYIPNVIAQADVRISIPVWKTHDIAGLTAAMKNSVGHLPADIYYSGTYSRGYEVRAAIHQAYPYGPAAAVADINAVVPYQFVVVDALTAHRYGPWDASPDRIFPNAIVSGRDAVAVDTVMASAAGWDATAIDYLVYGQNDGTGVCDSGYILARGMSVNDLRSDLASRFPGKIPFPIGFGTGINATWGSEAAETNPPWVTVTSPGTGDPVSGTVSIAFDCGDAEGVAKAELFVDGVPAGHLPYPTGSGTFSWDSSTASPGSHILTVVVTDGPFNQASDSVNVSIAAAVPTFELY
jgi:uncharacterized protein (DUF362 family)